MTIGATGAQREPVACPAGTGDPWVAPARIHISVPPGRSTKYSAAEATARTRQPVVALALLEPSASPCSHQRIEVRRAARIAATAPVALTNYSADEQVGEVGGGDEPADTTWRIYDHDTLIVEVPRTTTKNIARFKVHKPERLDDGQSTTSAADPVSDTLPPWRHHS